MKPYIPDPLPLEDLNHKVLLPLVGEANAELARYDGLLQGIPNPAVMLSPLTTQEAVLSSKIEGTQATVDEVLEHEAGLLKEGEKYKDIQEISNYREALFKASDHLQNYPIRINLICELHKILLSSVRGENKSPGAIRKDQNWIGKAGCTIEEATFVPPEPLQLNNYLMAWQEYLDFDDLDFLLQTAVVHAQFELLHPFQDGNGRIGRILIPLFLFQKKKLSQPMFYLSEYLEKNRDAYYEKLKGISKDHDWNSWIVFFLQAISSQAKQNGNRVEKIQKLYEKMKIEIRDITRSQYSVNLVDAIFTKPIFRTVDTAKWLNKDFGVHEKTVTDLLRQLKEANILRELFAASGRRAAVLCFPDLINLTEGRDLV
jgi:Fic family protein